MLDMPDSNIKMLFNVDKNILTDKIILQIKRNAYKRLILCSEKKRYLIKPLVLFRRKFEGYCWDIQKKMYYDASSI